MEKPFPAPDAARSKALAADLRLPDPQSTMATVCMGGRRLKHALGRWYRIRLPWVGSDGDLQRPRQALVAGLDDVVAVGSVQRLDMERAAGSLGESLEPLLEQFRVHLAQLVAGEI